MNSVIIDELIRSIKEINIDGHDKPKFSDSSYKAYEISEKNYHELPEIKSSSKITFIDGGNAEIFKAPNLSMQYIRVCAGIFKGPKKISSQKHEFYALIKAIPKEEIYYSVQIFNQKDSFFDKEKLQFNSFDKTLVQGNNRVSISRIADVIRRFAELNLAEKIITNLDVGDIIILDGDLEAKYTHEKEYLEILYKEAQAKTIAISALSKTCSILTDTGNSLIAALSIIAPKDSWYYYPVADINSEQHKVDMYFLKLHPKSKYVFKFENYKKNKKNIQEILSILKDHAKDPIFLGYPYGLIEADREARVSNQEQNYIKTKLMAKLGKQWKDIESYSNSLNAHDILDKIG